MLAPYRIRARQWSRTAWTAALLFGSLPVAGRLVLGNWAFTGAAEIGCLFLIAAAYLHFVSGPPFSTAPDPAMALDQAGQLVAQGQVEEAIALLTETIRHSPKLWQAFQYRGELYLGARNDAASAWRDFSEAIRLAPDEAHLYALREQARVSETE